MKRLLLIPAFACAALFGAAGLQAAGFGFDGGKNAPLSASYAAFAAPAPSAPALTPPQPAGLRVYDFKQLYPALGYRPNAEYGAAGGPLAAFGATADEIQDLDTYASKEDTYYAEVNSYLRFHPAAYDWYGISPQTAASMVENIDALFAKVPALPADLAVFRGLDLKFRGGRPYAVGEEFADKGYVSTSMSYRTARYFAVEMNDNASTPSRKAVFAMYFSGAERNILVDQGEDEVLLGHGRKFRVMAQKPGVKKYDLYLVQVCAAACDAGLRPGVKAFWDGLEVND